MYSVSGVTWRPQDLLALPLLPSGGECSTAVYFPISLIVSWGQCPAENIHHLNSMASVPRFSVALVIYDQILFNKVIFILNTFRARYG